MTKAHNPYASALDGLVLEDPVAAFFDFCREREAIRLARERGESAPWSHDPVFQRGRFLNVFREDDRVTKAILRFHERLDLAPEDLERRVQAALFARWCNRDATLDVLRCEPGVLDRPSEFRNLLETLPEQPWCNATAYPVEPVRWEGEGKGKPSPGCEDSYDRRV